MVSVTFPHGGVQLNYLQFKGRKLHIKAGKKKVGGEGRLWPLMKI